MSDSPIGLRDHALQLRITGQVQGVGFRPFAWRLAQRYGLRGSVCNDGQGVAIHVCGPGDALGHFLSALRLEAPPLARIDTVTSREGTWLAPNVGFRITSSLAGTVRTGVASDAATCAACIAETLEPATRRIGYAFTNCTHCGPRLSITTRIPYDRIHTTMQGFPMCAGCRAEYDDPADRRFHAQAIACPDCGPRLWLESGHTAAADTRLPDDAPLPECVLPPDHVPLPVCNPAPDGAPLPDDVIQAAQALLARGAIVAIKGMGGFQLACDATNNAAVMRLRQRKHRATKPLALMARDLSMVHGLARADADEMACLCEPAAPIVLLDRLPGVVLADGIAPGVNTLGCMLPNTPLHHLLLRDLPFPIVLTSGNLSDAPQLVDNDAARTGLAQVADAWLMHDRPITRRVDDSVLRKMAGTMRVLRRARGLAPTAITLHPGFAAAAPVLAMGGDLKNSFCLLRAGQAVVSHHIGDLRDARTLADYRQAIADYRQLFDLRPAQIAIDMHPQSLAGKVGRAIRTDNGNANANANANADDMVDPGKDALAATHDQARTRPSPTVVEVQHHHAHIAACLADNGVPPDAPDVLGIVFDGMGYGMDGTVWGGEFLRANYRGFERLARLRPVALPGADAAAREPWRNTHAQLEAAFGWPASEQRLRGLDLLGRLRAKPLAVLDTMRVSGINSPLASSAGRLFDAVAAACGICFEQVGHEGQAAMELEACADRPTLDSEPDRQAYPFAIDAGNDGALPCLDPAPMWHALLEDLHRSVPVGVISARFHKGLAMAAARMVQHLRSAPGTEHDRLQTVALSGGVFQNRILLEQLARRLHDAGLAVLTHRQVPANDGGLSLGQAAVAAARALAAGVHPEASGLPNLR